MVAGTGDGRGPLQSQPGAPFGLVLVPLSSIGLLLPDVCLWTPPAPREWAFPWRFNTTSLYAPPAAQSLFGTCSSKSPSPFFMAAVSDYSSQDTRHSAIKSMGLLGFRSPPAGQRTIVQHEINIKVEGERQVKGSDPFSMML